MLQCCAGEVNMKISRVQRPCRTRKSRVLKTTADGCASFNVKLCWDWRDRRRVEAAEMKLARSLPGHRLWRWYSIRITSVMTKAMCIKMSWGWKTLEFRIYFCNISVQVKDMSRFMRFVAGVSQEMFSFDNTSVHMGFVVNKVALEQDLSSSTSVFPC